MQDAWGDVQLLLLLNGFLVVIGGLARRWLVDGNVPAQLVDYWQDIYGASVCHSYPIMMWLHAGRPQPTSCLGRCSV